MGYGVRKMLLLKGIDNLSKKQFLIKRLGLSSTTLACLCGTGCSGKSLLLQYIAICVSSGTNLFNKYDVNKGKVSYIDQEQSEDQSQLRLERICEALHVKDICIERIVLNSRLDSPKLDKDELEEALIKDFSQSVLVIIDSLKAVTEADENSSDIEKTLKMLKRVAEKANCCILVCHHKGKGRDSKQSGRGHSSIYDSFDCQIDISLNDDKYNLRCAKMRDGRYFDGIEYVILDEGRFIEAQNCTSQLHFKLLNENVRSAGDNQKTKILKALSKMDSVINNRDLYNLVKGDKNTFCKILSSLLEQNLIEETRGAKNSRLFKITVKGQTALVFAID